MPSFYTPTFFFTPMTLHFFLKYWDFANFPYEIQNQKSKFFCSASTMGSGDWLKNIISLNKARKQKLKSRTLPNGFILETQSQEESTKKVNYVANRHREVVVLPCEDIAAIRIQTAVRAFMARKALRHLKGTLRLQIITRGDFGKKQTSNALKLLQSWSKIQAQIRTRRLGMVKEGGIKQKKLENQSKLEAKLRDLEVEWSGGSHTMDVALAKIQQREEAATKRERAMAYAFSHQWRAKSKSNLGPNDSELATANWGWSWTERWIAARPWESRALVMSTPKKVNSPSNKVKILKSPSMKKSNSTKTSPNGKKTARNRKLAYGSTTKVEDANTNTENLVTK